MHGTTSPPVDAPPTVAPQRAYRSEADRYDRRTAGFMEIRERIVAALALRPGDVVLDVGCGTGLCFPALRAAVGPTGRVIGVDAAPAMVDLARSRIEGQGWDNVEVVHATAAQARLETRPDAALFCAVHDVMRSGEALRQVVGQLRPGARVAAGGGKWTPWLTPLNAQVAALHAPYVSSFEGFDKPWSRLAPLLEDVTVTDLVMSTGYLMTGRVPAATPR